MLRYIKRLESRDLSLTASMIPLGSCTDEAQRRGGDVFPCRGRSSRRFIRSRRSNRRAVTRRCLSNSKLAREITGFAGISLQPNAGSQGEYAGLLVIRAYHESRGDAIATSVSFPPAHGTEPASAVAVWRVMKVVAVACDTNGNIDVADLKARKPRRTVGRSRA